MKTEDVGSYKDIWKFENFYQAHRLARRSKRAKKEVVAFEIDLAYQLWKLSYELEHELYKVSPYRRFKIYDPKEREIYALPYRDRIVQHNVCDNIIGPYMERHLIYDNAASRAGKGTHNIKRFVGELFFQG